MNSIRLSVFIGLVLPGISRCAVAAVPWGYGAEADFNRQYVYQGIAYDRGLLFQPSAWVSKAGFTFMYWGNDVVSNDNYSALNYSGKIFPEYPAPPFTGFKEHDLSLSYEGTWHHIDFKPMITAYTGDRVDLVFHQPFYNVISVQLSYPIAGLLKAYTIQSTGVGRLEGTYFGEFGAAWEQKIGKATLTASAELGVGGAEYNLDTLGLSKTALNLFQSGLALSYPCTEHVYVKPHMEFYSILDDDLRPFLTPPAKPNTFNLGFAVGIKY